MGIHWTLLITLNSGKPTTLYISESFWCWDNGVLHQPTQLWPNHCGNFTPLFQFCPQILCVYFRYLHFDVQSKFQFLDATWTQAGGTAHPSFPLTLSSAGSFEICFSVTNELHDIWRKGSSIQTRTESIYSIFQANPLSQKTIHTFRMSTALPMIICTEMHCVNRLMFDVDKQTHTPFCHLYNCGASLQINHLFWNPTYALWLKTYRKARITACTICIEKVLHVSFYASAMHLHIPLVRDQKGISLSNQRYIFAPQARVLGVKSLNSEEFLLASRDTAQSNRMPYTVTCKTMVFNFNVLIKVTMLAKAAQSKSAFTLLVFLAMSHNLAFTGMHPFNNKPI